MKVLPALSKATSVTWRKRPSSAGSGGFGCLSGAVSSSEASCLRPKTSSTLPAGLNLITMSEPLSATQMFWPRSMRTVWPNDQAYRFLPISRTNLPVASNSSNCAAAAAYAGPVVLPRDSTKMWPLAFTATPVASPRYVSFGICSGSDPSKGITGTSCANAGEASASDRATSSFFMVLSSGVDAIGLGEIYSEYIRRHDSRNSSNAAHAPRRRLPRRRGARRRPGGNADLAGSLGRRPGLRPEIPRLGQPQDPPPALHRGELRTFLFRRLPRRCEHRWRRRQPLPGPALALRSGPFGGARRAQGVRRCEAAGAGRRQAHRIRRCRPRLHGKLVCARRERPHRHSQPRPGNAREPERDRAPPRERPADVLRGPRPHLGRRALHADFLRRERRSERSLRAARVRHAPGFQQRSPG